jgi:hypothetical protein
VFNLHKGDGVVRVYATVYADGKRTLEFDSDRCYTLEELAEIIENVKQLKIGDG